MRITRGSGWNASTGGLSRYGSWNPARVAGSDWGIPSRNRTNRWPLLLVWSLRTERVLPVRTCTGRCRPTDSTHVLWGRKQALAPISPARRMRRRVEPMGPRPRPRIVGDLESCASPTPPSSIGLNMGPTRLRPPFATGRSHGSEPLRDPSELHPIPDGAGGLFTGP